MKNADEISPPPDKRRKSSPKLDKLQLYPQIKDKSTFKADHNTESIVSSASINNIKNWVHNLTSFQTRHSLSVHINDVADFLMEEFKKMHYTDVVFHEYNFQGRNLKNVICKKKGTNNNILIICAHYDSIMEHHNNFNARAPGANDNASGVAAILEIARILNPLKLNDNIQFVLFSGEEQNLVGSRAYAKYITDKNNMKPLKLINLDMIGNPAFNDGIIYVERDNNENPIHNRNPNNDEESIRFGEIMKQMVNYTDLQVRLDSIYNSDYAPFEELGHICIGAYDGSAVDENPHYHSSTDGESLLNYSYLTSVSKMVLATILTIGTGTDAKAIGTGTDAKAIGTGTDAKAIGTGTDAKPKVTEGASITDLPQNSTGGPGVPITTPERGTDTKPIGTEDTIPPPTVEDPEFINQRKRLQDAIEKVDIWVSTGVENGLFINDPNKTTYQLIIDKMKSSKANLKKGDLIESDHDLDEVLDKYSDAKHAMSTRWRLFNIYALDVYLYLIGFLALIFAFYVSKLDEFSQQPPFVQTALHAATWGAIGAILRGLWFLKEGVGEGKYRKTWRILYYSYPFLGGIFGTLTYLILVAGLLTFGGNDALDELTNGNATSGNQIEKPVDETASSGNQVGKPGENASDSSNDKPNPLSPRNLLFIPIAALAGFNWEWFMIIFNRLADIFTVTEKKPTEKIPT
jgi:hypothetical protein